MVGAQEAECALPAFLQQKDEEEEAAEEERMEELNENVLARIPLSSAEGVAWRQWAGLPPQSSSSSGRKRRNKRKRRKKKVPKTHSSSSLRRAVVHQGNMFGYADKLSLEVHCKEVTGYSDQAETAPCMNGTWSVHQREGDQGAGVRIHPQERAAWVELVR